LANANIANIFVTTGLNYRTLLKALLEKKRFQIKQNAVIERKGKLI